MKNVLYIGNYLKNDKVNPSYMFSLADYLRSQDYAVRISSSKRNKLLRLLDMVVHIFRYGKWANTVLIDTYSTTNFYYAYVISQLCRLFKIKYIPILHGGNLPNRLTKSTTKSKQIFNNAHINVAPSAYLKEAFENMGYSNVIHIPNAINISDYQYEPKDLDGTIRILWVRAFRTIYNPQLVIKVLRLLLDKGYDAKLCMIGPDVDGSLKDVKQLASQLNVDVEFKGKMKKQDWILESRSHTIFVNSTNFDNTPLTVIEAMALGMPVVSTNVGGMPFLISNREDGLLVEANNATQMMEAIIGLYNSPNEASEMVLKARKKVEAFDWVHVGKQWKTIL